MSLPDNRWPNRRQWRYLLGTILAGMLGLVGLSVLQKWVIGAPLLTVYGYVVPALFGGGAGFLFGYFSLGRRQRIRALERESEIRRLISGVNHRLVDAATIGEMAPAIAEIVGSSSLFECTYVCLLESTGFDRICVENTDLSESEVRSFHTERYVESVAEARSLRLSDVTTGPMAQHTGSKPSHEGIGIAISHEEEVYGVLTVHFPPDVSPSPDEIELLETIGTDFGYFVHSRIVEAERESFARILERIDDPVMVQNRDGTFREINEAVADYANMEREELIGRDEFAFMNEGAARTVQDMKQRVLETETAVSYQVRPTFPDGRERVFSTTRYPSYDEQGTIDGTLAICRDVTDLETHQRQLRVLDRVLRHNVNNNMNVVQGYAEMIAEEAGGEIARQADKIRANSDRLLDIAEKQRKITDFLSEPQATERIDISTLVGRIISRTEQEFPEATITVRAPDTAQAWAIQSIEEAFEELLRNSIVHAGANPAPTVTVERGKETVQVRVTDRNPPMADMDRQVLTGRNELGALRHGSGLGLWLVKLITDHAGGSITYAENEPTGNVVTIELPRTGEENEDPSTHSENEPTT